MVLKAPFPWFGGKSRVAHLVWQAFGDVDNYVEPFAGSLAVLLGRPAEHEKKVETVNDLDGYLVNFWRAVKHDPEGVARYANNPVSEVDLMSRHMWLVRNGAELLERLFVDPEYYDVKAAGWWVWGISSWIGGGGWCYGDGPWCVVDGRLVKVSSDQRVRGVWRQVPSLSRNQGINAQRVRGVRRILPSLSGNRGVHSQRVMGVSRGLPYLSRRQGIHVLRMRGGGNGTDTGLDGLIEHMKALAERLRYVRVACGDWRRVVTKGALAFGNTVGIFLDPPYSADMRDGEIYNTDQLNGRDVSREVYKWCMENADNPRYRIVLCGYEGEHEMPDTWRKIAWSGGRVYGRKDKQTGNAINRHKERIWFSPNCLEVNE